MTEVAASIQNITPRCRENHGDLGALHEAFRRIEAAYADYVTARDNEFVTWRVSLVRVEAAQ